MLYGFKGEVPDEEFLVPVEDDEELERAFVAFQEQSEFCEDDGEEE